MQFVYVETTDSCCSHYWLKTAKVQRFSSVFCPVNTFLSSSKHSLRAFFRIFAINFILLRHKLSLDQIQLQTGRCMSQTPILQLCSAYTLHTACIHSVWVLPLGISLDTAQAFLVKRSYLVFLSYTMSNVFQVWRHLLSLLLILDLL